MADVSLVRQDVCMEDISVWLMSLVRQDVCMEDISVWLMLLYVKMSAWKTSLYG